MAITPYRPATDLLNPILEDFFRPVAGWGGRMGDLMRAPESDVVETPNEIRVMVEMPGMKRDDISLDLENNVLTVSGEKKESRQREGEGNTWHLSERRYGRFSRSFVLPRDVDQDRIDAHFEDGVLLVSIPKSERAKRRRIEVRDGSGDSQRIESGAKKK